MLRFQLYDTTEQGARPVNESDTLGQLCEDLEYGDVVDGHYFVLDKVNGVKYSLQADRKVEDEDYYSVPETSHGTVWQPVLGHKMPLIKYDSIISRFIESYDQATDDFNWDTVDWDTVFADLQYLIRDDKIAARKLFDEYITSNDVPHKLFAIILAGEMMNPVEEGEEGIAAGLISQLSELSLKLDRVDYLDAIATSLGHTYMKEAKTALLRLSEHPSKQVRLSATVSLNSQDENDPEVRSRLEQLASDDDPEIRDWASYYLDAETE